MKKTLLTLIAVLLGVQVASASPILFDYNGGREEAQGASVGDFTAAGVTEDLTGAAVWNEDSGKLTIAFEGTRNGWAYDSGLFSDNGLLRDYMATNNASNSAAVSGLHKHLAPSTQYTLYIFAAGDDASQGATITFDGETKTTALDENDPTSASVKFDFTTPGTLDDTYELGWSWVATSSGVWSANNGFAIVPEPASLAVLSIGGLMGLMRRRRR